MPRFGNPSGAGRTRKDPLPSSSKGGPSADAKFKRSGTHGFLPRGVETGHATREAAEKAAREAPNQDLYTRRVIEISKPLAGSHFAGDGSKHRFVVVATKRPTQYLGGQDDADDARRDADSLRADGFHDVEVRRETGRGGPYAIYGVPPRGYVKGEDY